MSGIWTALLSLFMFIIKSMWNATMQTRVHFSAMSFGFTSVTSSQPVIKLPFQTRRIPNSVFATAKPGTFCAFVGGAAVRGEGAGGRSSSRGDWGYWRNPGKCWKIITQIQHSVADHSAAARLMLLRRVLGCQCMCWYPFLTTSVDSETYNKQLALTYSP